MDNIMNGEELSKQIEEEVKQFAKQCIIRPSVAIIDIGDNKDNEMFIKAQEDACNRVGVYLRRYEYGLDTSELTIINKIKELNNDDYVNGIMLTLPIPEKYNEKRLINTIINSKDIDGLTDINIGRLISGRKSVTPCIVLAIIELLKSYNVTIEGKDIVIVGKGKLIGSPLISVLLDEGATVTVCHSKTKDLKKHTSSADIIISAAGVKKLITADMIKDGAIVVDIGINSVNGKVYGDVDFDKVVKKASLITPIVGGVGPVMIAMLLRNTILCYNNTRK